MKGRLSYVSQEPWMFMGTIRDNILFGMAYDSVWYNKVIDACSLDEVIQLKLKRMVYIIHFLSRISSSFHMVT